MVEGPHFAVANGVELFDDFIQFSPKFGPLFEGLIPLAGYAAGHHISRGLIVGRKIP